MLVLLLTRCRDMVFMCTGAQLRETFAAFRTSGVGGLHTCSVVPIFREFEVCQAPFRLVLVDHTVQYAYFVVDVSATPGAQSEGVFEGVGRSWLRFRAG